MMGLSTRGSISLGIAFVAGKKRVPNPAAGKTALRTFNISTQHSAFSNQPKLCVLCVSLSFRIDLRNQRCKHSLYFNSLCTELLVFCFFPGFPNRSQGSDDFRVQKRNPLHYKEIARNLRYRFAHSLPQYW